MNLLRKCTPLLVALVVLAATGCDSGSEDIVSRTGAFDGPAEAVGNGSAYVSVTLDDGVPTAIAVVLTEAALTGLSGEAEHGVDETVLALPEEAAVAPYDHVSLDWNPAGHDPPGVYDRPHFDVHFYFMSQAERDAIDPAAADFEAKASAMPEPQYIPAGYVPTPGAVPRMGAHWINPQSPEFSEAGFSQTFIYGFWDGRMVFLEPMITRAFLQTLPASGDPSASVPIPQPEAFALSGYYPTRYHVRYDAEAEVFVVALEGLQKR